MAIDCAGSERTAVLTERYPEFSLLLWDEPSNPYQFCANSDGKPNAHRDGRFLHSDSIDKEMKLFQKKLHLESIDLLYVFGIGLGHCYPFLERWLLEKKERSVIFLEDDLAVIDAFSRTAHAQALLSNPQVHLRFVPSGSDWKEIIDDLVKTYPCERVEVAALSSYGKERGALFKKIRLELMRKSTTCHALMTEAIYSHRLTQNILRNIRLWPDSFFANRLKGQFKGIPAIICGAGPSLGSSIALLKEVEDKALIIAGGSTIAALSNQGITPHLAMALDPNPEEYDRLRSASAYEVPLIYGTRVQPDIFSTCNGPKGYIHSHTGGPCEVFFERELAIEEDPIGPDLGQEALSVTTLAIAFAVEMGCNPILLNGIDLAYTGMQRYAEGIMSSSKVALKELQKEVRASDRLLKRKGITGEVVHTLVKWVMESSCISSYAKEHPETRFINTSSSGLGFDGIKNIPFSEAAKEHLTCSYDLRGMIHSKICQSGLKSLNAVEIQAKMQESLESLQRLLRISDEMLEELEKEIPLEKPFPTARMTILQIDFEEEKAFECFFQNVGPSLDALLNRSHPFSYALDEKKRRANQTERLKMKWKHFRMAIENQIAHLVS